MLKKIQENKQTKKITFKKWSVKWIKGKLTQIMILKKDNLQIFTF